APGDARRIERRLIRINPQIAAPILEPATEATGGVSGDDAVIDAEHPTGVQDTAAVALGPVLSNGRIENGDGSGIEDASAFGTFPKAAGYVVRNQCFAERNGAAIVEQSAAMAGEQVELDAGDVVLQR